MLYLFWSIFLKKIAWFLSLGFALLPLFMGCGIFDPAMRDSEGYFVRHFECCGPRAIEKALLGNWPYLIEAITYRHSCNSRSDPAKYRPKEEAEELKTKLEEAGATVTLN